MRLVLILTMVDILSNTLITIANATGKIRNYQLVVGGMLLMNFPLSYLCLYLGFPPESTLVVAIWVSLLCLILRLVFLRKMAQLSTNSFLRNVCARVLIVVVIASIIPTILHYNISYVWQRLVIVGCTSIINCIVVIFYLGCNKGERETIFSKMALLKKNLKKSNIKFLFNR